MSENKRQYTVNSVFGGTASDRRIAPTAGDIIIIVAVALSAILSAALLHAFSSSSDGQYAVITGDNPERCPLDRDASYTLESRGVTLTVTVSGGAVSVTAADCPDRLCVATGAISHSGQAIVCVPAHITVTISGGDADADFIAG